MTASILMRIPDNPTCDGSPPSATNSWWRAISSMRFCGRSAYVYKRIGAPADDREVRPN